MDIQRLKSMSPSDRLHIMQAEAVGIESGRYARPLSPEELAKYKDVIADKSIEQATILNELATIKEDFKLKLDPLKAELKVALEAVQYRAINETGELYNMPDYENKMIYRLTKDGDVISSRQMLPEERQHRMSAMRDAI